MNNILKILLIEDDVNTCNAFQSYIDTVNEIVLTHTTNNAKQALTYVISESPHAIILDLELTRGSGNGLTFLQNLNQANLLQRPFILVSTNNSSQTIYNRVHSLGADFIIHKHQEDYSEKMIVDFLYSMKHDLLKTTNFNKNIESSFSKTDHSEQQLRIYLSNELNLLGMSPKSKGYLYLIEAILLYTKDSSSKWCHIIGVTFKKSETSIERAMQNAIKRTWTIGDTEDLYRYYNGAIRSDRGYPTLMEFISYYSNKIRNFHP